MLLAVFFMLWRAQFFLTKVVFCLSVEPLRKFAMWFFCQSASLGADEMNTSVVEIFGQSLKSAATNVWWGWIGMVGILSLIMILGHNPISGEAIIINMIASYLFVVVAVLTTLMVVENGRGKFSLLFLLMTFPGIWFLINRFSWYRGLEHEWRETVKEKKFETDSKKVEELLMEMESSVNTSRDYSAALNHMFLSMDQQLLKDSPRIKGWAESFAEIAKKARYRDVCLTTKNRLCDCGIGLVIDTGYGAEAFLLSMGISSQGQRESVEQIMKDHSRCIEELEMHMDELINGIRDGILKPYALIQELLM